MARFSFGIFKKNDQLHYITAPDVVKKAGKLRLRRAATRVLAGKGKACYADNLV